MILSELNESIKTHFPSFIGVYLHGSLAMNCHNIHSSDIDIIIVSNNDLENIDFQELRNFTASIMVIEEKYSTSFEISIVKVQEVKSIKYPSHFIYHYSKMHKDRYRSNPSYLCGGYTDSDLVVHFKMIKEHGECLMGVPINEIFIDDYDIYFHDSVRNDCIASLSEYINNPTYFILNCCRTMMYLNTGKSGSKIDGGNWAIENLPGSFRELITETILDYQSSVTHELRKEEVEAFRNYFTSTYID